MNDNPWWPRQSDRARATRRPRDERRSRAATRRRACPSVLALEDRRLLTAIFTVTSPLDSGPGTLRDAIDQANHATTAAGSVEIDFDLGGPATIDLTSGQLDLSNTAVPIAIDGPGADALAVDGGGLSRVFMIESGVTASFSGLTVTDGSARYDMAGNIWNRGTLTLTGVTISRGVAALIGGLYNEGLATLDDCIVSGNSTGLDASALMNSNKATMVLHGDSIDDNEGGASAVSNGNFGGTLSVTSTTFSGNVGTTIASNGTLSLLDCTVSGDPSTVGGSGEYGINVRFGVATIENCTVEDCPGGIWNI